MKIKNKLAIPIIVVLLLIGGIVSAGTIGDTQTGSTDTSSKLSAEWWQWVLSIPPSANPMLDTTGHNCFVGQRGPIWFLAGIFQSGTITRTCSIPQGKQLFFPVLNYVNISAPGIGGQGPENYLVKDMRKDTAAYINNATNLSVILDGKKINEINRIKSYVFEVALPADNLFGVPAGIYSPAVDEGFYVTLGPLDIGTHTLHFHAENPNAAFSLDVTYNLNVVPVILH